MNKFFRPMNQFLQPRSCHNNNNDHRRMRYDDNDLNDYDDEGDNNDAYDSAYAKYYDD